MSHRRANFVGWSAGCSGAGLLTGERRELRASVRVLWWSGVGSTRVVSGCQQHDPSGMKKRALVYIRNQSLYLPALHFIPPLLPFLFSSITSAFAVWMFPLNIGVLSPALSLFDSISLNHIHHRPSWTHNNNNQTMSPCIPSIPLSLPFARGTTTIHSVSSLASSALSITPSTPSLHPSHNQHFQTSTGIMPCALLAYALSISHVTLLSLSPSMPAGV